LTKEGDIGVDIAVAIDDPAWQSTLPNAEQHCRRSIFAALSGRLADEPSEVSVLLTDDAHMTCLNEKYRQRASSTNVLSFPADRSPAPAPATRLLGDIVLARETIVAEAEIQGKPVADHVAHLLVHGTLHLLGLDHQTDTDAGHMEALEVGVLAGLGIRDPYQTSGIARE
jgi:probable rRNA maturation factor